MKKIIYEISNIQEENITFKTVFLLFLYVLFMGIFKEGSGGLAPCQCAENSTIAYVTINALLLLFLGFLTLSIVAGIVFMAKNSVRTQKYNIFQAPFFIPLYYYNKMLTPIDYFFHLTGRLITTIRKLSHRSLNESKPKIKVKSLD